MAAIETSSRRVAHGLNLQGCLVVRRVPARGVLARAIARLIPVSGIQEQHKLLLYIAISCTRTGNATAGPELRSNLCLVNSTEDNKRSAR